jgi:hypothetical protein
MSSRTAFVRFLQCASAAAAALGMLACSSHSARAQSAVQQCIVRGGAFGKVVQPTELQAGVQPAATDTVLSILMNDTGDSRAGFAQNDFFVKHDRFVFRGEPYFLAYPGLFGRQFPHDTTSALPHHVPLTRATIAPVGEHAGVTLYAWQPERSDPIMILFVRHQSPCRVQQYWHVSQVRQ